MALVPPAMLGGAAVPRALVATFDPRLGGSNAGVSAANQARGQRAVIPQTGKLRDVAIYVSNSAGNIEVGYLNTAATTRSRVWTTGSIACPAAGWQIVGDPNLDVAAGDQVDFYLAADGTTATFLRMAPPAGSAVEVPIALWPSPLGGVARLAWSRATSLPMAASPTEASLSQSAAVFCVLARIS